MKALTQLAVGTHPLRWTATVVLVKTRQTFASVEALLRGPGTWRSVKLRDVTE